MPSSDGTVLDPGRERAKEKKRAEGAELVGAMPKILEANGAPSRLSPAMGIMACAIREFEGRARPRTPLNSCSRGSDSTFVAAAVRGEGWCQQRETE